MLSNGEYLGETITYIGCPTDIVVCGIYIGSAKHAPIWDIFSVLKPSNIERRLGEIIILEILKNEKKYVMCNYFHG